MKWQTHLSFGILLGLVFFDSVLLSFFVGFCALLPDIDKFNSKISKKFRALSFLFLIIPHRKFTHSVWFFFVAGLFYWNSQLFWGCVLGIVSHLIIDSLTPAGTRPFFPFKLKVKFILKTGSFYEKILYLIFVLGDVLLVASKIVIK